MPKFHSDGDEDSLASGAFAAVSRLRGVVGSPGASCRYGLGDPHSKAFMFCDNDAHLEGPYCAFHARLCFQSKG
jgi:GcrA cell cycle regulator